MTNEITMTHEGHTVRMRNMGGGKVAAFVYSDGVEPEVSIGSIDSARSMWIGLALVGFETKGSADDFFAACERGEVHDPFAGVE